MKKIKGILSVIAVLLLALSLCGCESTAPLNPTERFFVNDFADVITDADENTIYSAGVALDKACGAQVVVVTVDSLGGESIEDFSYDLATEWQLGDEEKDNGILLLLSVDDREVRVEVGSGLEGALPDSKTGRILDTYGMDYFADDNFSAGLTNVYSALVNEVHIEYGLPYNDGYTPIDEIEYVEDEMSVLDIVITVIVIAGIIAFFALPGGHGGSKFGRIMLFNSMFGGRGGFHGGHRGGFSGGGFRGGGGGFSGGGASRGF